MSNTINKIEAIADIKTGYPLREAASHSSRGNALLVQMKDVNSTNGINWSTPISIETKGRKEPEWLRDGDILFVGRGSRFFATPVSMPPQNSIASPHFHVLRIKNPENLLPLFLVWTLNNADAQKYYAAHQEGSSLPYISRRTLSALPIPMPDLQKQRLIIETQICWKHQRQLMEKLIEQKEIFVEGILEHYLQQGAAI